MIRAELIRYLANWQPSDDRLDTADEAIVRFLVAKGKGLIDEDRNAAGYLLRIARHIAYDRLRRSRATESVSWAESMTPSLEDDFASQVVEEIDAAVTVERALDAAIKADDVNSVKALSAYLDLASRSHTAPSLREVGRWAGVSHTTVRRAMERARAWLITGKWVPSSSSRS